MTLNNDDKATMLRLYAEKAEIALNASKTETLDPYTRVNRAYYCAFYCATVLLLTRGIERSSHKGILSEFSKEFIKSGELPPELGHYSRHLEGMRYAADYNPRAEFTEEFADGASRMADFFYKATVRELEKIPEFLLDRELQKKIDEHFDSTTDRVEQNPTRKISFAKRTREASKNNRGR